MKKFADAGSLAFLFPFLIYVLTLCPTVHWGDSGELITAAYTLGIPHPPGHPLYAILGKLFTLIPLGSIAYRVNLMSAFFGGISCYLLYRIACDRLEPSPWRIAAALSGTFFFAFSTTAWDQSTVAETTTLHVSFMMLLTLLAFRLTSGKIIWRNETYSLCLFSFLYGLSMTNHVAGVFFLPAFIYLFLSSYGKKILAPRLLGKMIAACFIGGLVYLYLPIRSLSDPPLDWGNPETWSNFWWVITARQFSDNLVKKVDILFLPVNVWKRVQDLLQQYTLVGCVFGLAGIPALLRRERRFLIFTCIVLVILCYIGLNSAFISAYFVPALALIGVIIAAGIQWVIEILGAVSERLKKVSSVALLQKSVCSLLAAGFVLPLKLHYGEMDRSDDYYAYRYGTQILNQLPQNTLLFTADGYALFTLWYLTFCENERPDIMIVNPTWLVGGPCLASQVLEQYPSVRMPDLEVIRANASQGETVGQRQLLAVQRILDENVKVRPVYWGLILNQLPFFDHLECRGLVYAYSETPIPVSEESIEEAKAYWDGELEMYRHHPEMERTALLNDIYPVELNNQGLIFEEHGRDDLARWFIERSLVFNPKYPLSRYNLGRLEARAGNYEEAVDQYHLALKEDPKLAVAYYNLGNALKHLQRLEEAFLAYQKAVRADDSHYQAMTALAQLYALIEQHEKAVEYFQEALEIEPEYAFALRGLASSYLDTDQMVEARNVLEKSLRLEPNSAPALFSLAKYDARIGDTDGAEKALRRSIEIGGDPFLENAASDEDLKMVVLRMPEAQVSK
ncbi:MAG: DUF2723 domain-containing protein [Candidatus Abyssobacteria bacterium SURF_5]|uniref:DUF2723 domain-containing protein n=1 Tax=Abyssobacteria bacterium (strain SURF_5) TaxID=2093360 RepID=A0A3A4NQK9_ABYX5|nr:MAG: DUF2723 domain-containing protein [Candidatus Abyssubacteria bacterium SURF_5]